MLGMDVPAARQEEAQEAEAPEAPVKSLLKGLLRR